MPEIERLLQLERAHNSLEPLREVLDCSLFGKKGRTVCKEGCDGRRPENKKCMWMCTHLAGIY